MRALFLVSMLTACVILAPSASLVLAGGIQLTDRCKADDPGGAMLRAAREAVFQQCPCSPSTPHAIHILCAATVADHEAALGHLPQSCKLAVRICAAKTTCGRHSDKSVACCLKVGSGRQCRMAGSVEACHRMRGTPSIHTPSPCTSCCDACPNPGSGPSCGSLTGALLDFPATDF